MSRNIIKEYTDYTGKALKKYAKLIMNKYYDEEVFNKYLNKYLLLRYYNEEPWMGNNLKEHLNYYLNKIYEENKSNISKFIFELFKLLYYVDDVIDFDDNSLFSYADMINKIRILKLGIDDKTFSKEFTKLIEEDRKNKNRFLESIETKDFSLDIKMINPNIYTVQIDHNITVPKIFSDYAINKVWNGTIISEDKLEIEFYLLSKIILNDIIKGIFTNNYLIDFYISLLDKEKKIRRILNVIDNNICKEKIILKVSYQDFIKNKEEILKYTKEGYKFALCLDEEFIKSNTNSQILDIFKYIVVSDKKYLTAEIKNLRNLINIE